jgi:biopolymer transport protein ExbD
MRRHAIDEPDSPPQINIVPMIDVIFAILTFFIMSSLSLVRFEGLTVNLPKSQMVQPQKITVRTVVTVDAKGNLYLDKVPQKIEALSKAIQRFNRPNQDLLVVLNADGAVPHSKIVAVMDQVRQVKGAKLAIATQRKS